MFSRSHGPGVVSMKEEAQCRPQCVLIWNIKRDPAKKKRPLVFVFGMTHVNTKCDDGKHTGCHILGVVFGTLDYGGIPCFATVHWQRNRLW